MLPHSGPRTRTWQAVVDLGAELAALGDAAGARTPASIAIVLDWPSWWALELDSRPSTELSMVDILTDWYAPLWRRGYSVDFAHPESDLSAYALVLVPQLYSVTDAGAQRIIASAESGATVAIGYFSGAVDEHDRVRAGGYPAVWQELLGLWIEEYRPLVGGTTIEIRPCPDGTDDLLPHGQASVWSEHVHLSGSLAVLEYAQGELAGHPAVTRHVLEAGGRAWYVSADLDGASMDALVLRIVDDAGVLPILHETPPHGLEVAIRETSDRRFLFLLNHGPSTLVVDPTTTGVPIAWHRLATDAAVDATVAVPAGDVVILVANQERTSEPR
jgi:beta-galactosidase